MNVLSILLVFVGGGLGSVCRFAVSRAMLALQYSHKFPLATLISNILACGVMAVLVFLFTRGRMAGANSNLFWLIGFCGGFSTFSAFSYENWLLYRSASYGFLALNLLVSVGLCFLIFAVGAKSFSVSGG